MQKYYDYTFSLGRRNENCCLDFCCGLKFLREKLFDYVDIAAAPVLIDGKEAATLINRRSQLLESELSKLGVLKLQECKILENSYLRLR